MITYVCTKVAFILLHLCKSAGNNIDSMLGNPIGAKIIELDETDSTNSYAARLIYDQLPLEGTVIMAGFQNSGRGQRGSAWESKKFQNLLVSYILYPTFLPASAHFQLNQALSLSMYDFIRSNTQQPVKVKWPNDIMVGNRKIGGLLVENAIRNNKFSYTIAGMGININQTDFQTDSPKAVSLQLLEKKQFDLKKCLLQLNSHVDKWYSILRSGNDKKINEVYLNALYGVGEQVNFEKNGETFVAVLKGVNAQGQLVVSGDGGTDLLFNNKEIKFRF